MCQTDKQEPPKTAAKLEPSRLLFRAGSKRHILSNFAVSPLTHNGLDYQTAEHAYQHSKALHHQDYGLAVRIKRSRTAAQAKKAANDIKTNESWAKVKLGIMSSILKSKLNHSSKFQVALKETGTSQLVHNVENDSFWGCGEDGLGTNMLGLLLEELRKFDAPSVPPAQPHGTQATAQAPNVESAHHTQNNNIYFL
jgi:ribA/ribD-fused uncharacterized protein